ncbi:hypothetical protein Gotur_011574 [Gossypium turneri]
MVEPKSKIESIREWVVDHKLRTVGKFFSSSVFAWIFLKISEDLNAFGFLTKGCLWLSGIAGSIAYNWSQPGMKTSVKIIHARLHAQALTLAALAGAAAVEYYDHRNRAEADPYAKFLPADGYSHKD